MRRMYGDQRHGELLIQEVAYERRRFDRSLRGGRLLQILDEHDMQDLQNLDELRTLAQRAKRFDEPDLLIYGQPERPEPRRSVRFNSRYSSFDDPPAVPVVEEDVDIELLPSSTTSSLQSSYSLSRPSELNSNQSPLKIIEHSNTQQTSNALDAKTEASLLMANRPAIEASDEISSGFSVSVMASGKPFGPLRDLNGFLHNTRQPSTTVMPSDRGTAWTAASSSLTTEQPEAIFKGEAAMYSSRTYEGQQPDNEMVFSSIDDPLHNNHLRVSDSPQLEPTSAATSSILNVVTAFSKASSTVASTGSVRSPEPVQTQKASTPGGTLRPRRRPPLTLEEPLTVHKEEDRQPSAQIKGIAACPTKEEVVSPYWANTTRGEVLALLNVHPFEQYIHSETCAFDNQQMLCRRGCKCEQQFRLHRLLAFDPRDDCRGVFSDWFRFPAGCVCVCYDLFGLSGLLNV
ncbi:spaetzle 4 precursor-like [Tropilaelaps mercedesae]|uniref:Spaetzle 4-like n=1 Tax=Tropilaelaps mercedesae TaxID=418985 RepID=A0A1V9XJT1_9ACAR|nr:spaetzle 4 precursor-like [Tropilaelaps mercedesae]